MIERLLVLRAAASFLGEPSAMMRGQS